MKKTTAIFAHLLSQGFDADTAFSISFRHEGMYLLCYNNAYNLRFFNDFFPGKLDTLTYCTSTKSYTVQFEYTLNEESCMIYLSFYFI